MWLMSPVSNGTVKSKNKSFGRSNKFYLHIIGDAIVCSFFSSFFFSFILRFNYMHAWNMLDGLFDFLAKMCNSNKFTNIKNGKDLRQRRRIYRNEFHVNLRDTSTD